MALLRKISFDGHESDVQNFVAGDNVTFATQSDGSIKINASGSGGGEECKQYTIAWDPDTNSLRITNNKDATVGTEPITFKTLRIGNATTYIEFDTENVAVNMSANMKAALQAALA